MELDSISRRFAAEPATLLHQALRESYLATTGELDDDTSAFLESLAQQAAARLGMYTQWIAVSSRDGQRVVSPTSDRQAVLDRADLLQLELRRRVLTRWRPDPQQPPHR